MQGGAEDGFGDPPRVALVTGAGRRIGAAIARALHRAGHAVAIHYRGSREAAEALAGEFEAARAGSAVALHADLLEERAPARLVEETVRRLGALDVLVNNASLFHATPFGEIGGQDWDALLGVNLRAPLFLTQCAAPRLRAREGCVVNLTDVYARSALAGHAVYGCAKAGLEMLTRVLALDLAPQVRVNAVAPGAILWPEGEAGSAKTQAVLARTALRRRGRPEDVAAAVLHLVRDAPYTTGAVLPVDGGRLN